MEKINRKALNVIYFFLFFVILSSPLIYKSFYSYQKIKNANLQNQCESQRIVWKGTINAYNNSVDTFFDVFIYTPKILNILKEIDYSDNLSIIIGREKLIKEVSPIYDYLKKRGVGQLHFHTTDCRSLLRMHAMDRFGDYLVKERPDVCKANRTMEVVRSFEVGKSISGFRNVYPIIFEGRHLGSVEISYSFALLRKTINSFYTEKDFILLINKKSWEMMFPLQSHSYTESPFSSDWLFEKMSSDIYSNFLVLTKDIANFLKKDKTFLEILNQGREQAIELRQNEEHYEIVIIPIFNTNKIHIASLVSVSKSEHLKTIHKTLIIEITSFILLSGIASYLLVIVYNYFRRIKEQEEQFTIIANSIYDGLYVLNAEGKTVFVNDRASEILQFSRDELINTYGHDLFHKHPFDRKNCPIFKTIASGSTYVDEEIFIRKDGEELNVRVAAKPVTMRGKPVTVVIFGDITPQKRQMEELKILKSKAEEANMAKSRFLAIMSHEIRTPLNAIIGACELMKEVEIDSGTKELLNVVYESGKHLLELINDILDLSKMESGSLLLEEIPFEINVLLNKVISIATPLASRKQLELILEPLEKDTVVIGDPYRVSQILTNLTSNAIKFTDKGFVKVSARILSDESDKITVEFKVADTGIGIAEDKIDLLFKTFSQVDASHTRKYGGTGLGLAICKSLVTFMNGSINVSSKEKEGSTFTVIIPFKKGIAEHLPFMEKEQLYEKREMPIRFHDIKVLLVEDAPTNIFIATRIFEKLGIGVDIAKNGKEAIDKLKNNTYDIVFMDVEMPEIDGISATNIIRNSPDILNRDTYIIAMTANAFKEDKELCLKAGMNDFISKPITINALSAILRKFFPEKAEASSATDKKRSDLEKMLDVKRLEGIMEDKGSIPELLKIFIEDTDKTITELTSAVKAGDSPAVVMLSHKIKGSAINIGAKLLGNAAKELEVSARKESIDEYGKKMEDLVATYETFKKIIKRHYQID